MSAEVFPRVTVDPAICFGKPTIRGMRIRVSDVLGMLAGGMSAAEILADFPYLQAEDITAAIAYTAKATDQRLAFAAIEWREEDEPIVVPPAVADDTVGGLVITH